MLDNDDFQDDTLTCSNTSHRTNVMFVQTENLLSSSSDSSKLTLAKPKDLKNITTEQHHFEPYKTMKRVHLLSRPEVDISLKNTKDQRMRGMIHSLARLDASCHCLPPETQQVGAFTGFQSCIHKGVVRSKAYYFLTFPKPPQKSVVHQVMCKMIKAAETNMMPFIQLVGDQPVYTLIVQFLALSILTCPSYRQSRNISNGQE